MFDSAPVAGCRVCGRCTQCRGRGGSFLTLPALVFWACRPWWPCHRYRGPCCPATSPGLGLSRTPRAATGLSMRLLVVLSLIGGCGGRRCCSRRMPPSPRGALAAAGGHGVIVRLRPQLRSMLAGGKPSAKATVGVLAVATYGGFFQRRAGHLAAGLVPGCWGKRAQRHERRRTGSRPCSRPLPWSSTPPGGVGPH